MANVFGAPRKKVRENEVCRLYLTKSLLVCRSCSGVTYDSPHSEEVNNIIKMIDKQRIKTHGKEQLELYQPNYLEYTSWIPRPKWKKTTKHQEDITRLETLERRLKTISEQRFGKI
ncbi:hypothetical protein [Paraglaciecola sp. 2405UD69-4]|uniref:hypothetical protein n=1 Tax=Paraglaciecola sp. 2405UD69-4 TaxID=3391836 RepID=UPI0039C8DE96